MRLQPAKQVGAGKMEDYDKDGDDRERSDAERRITRIHSRRFGAPGGWRGRAGYFRRHFDCSFRLAGVAASSWQDQSGPLLRSDDDNDKARGSRRGAANGATLRAGARKSPFVRVAQARFRRLSASPIPTCWCVFRAGKMSARAKTRCEIVHSRFIARHKWT